MWVSYLITPVVRVWSSPNCTDENYYIFSSSNGEMYKITNEETGFRENEKRGDHLPTKTMVGLTFQEFYFKTKTF